MPPFPTSSSSSYRPAISSPTIPLRRRQSRHLRSLVASVEPTAHGPRYDAGKAGISAPWSPPSSLRLMEGIFPTRALLRRKHVLERALPHVQRLVQLAVCNRQRDEHTHHVGVDPRAHQQQP